MQTSIAIADYTTIIRKNTVTGTGAKMNYSAAKKAAITIRAFDHIIRRRIIQLLGENKRLQVSDIYEQLGLQQAVASQHLAILRKEKIVTIEYTKNDCRVIYYSLNHTRISEIASNFMNLVA